ncbi:hypothetical protein ARMGADRAFT_1086270 [Armillaria gallica]|uniref:Uncharacterized protein n=1 Tax=Armillaria gallica TaxID=47427 RepID=A0A2H3CUR8_ARMGA|nr:hypothetical protein ARMGADRAFT_1086270 [Armillaria gallica]
MTQTSSPGTTLRPRSKSSKRNGLPRTLPGSDESQAKCLKLAKTFASSTTMPEVDLNIALSQKNHELDNNNGGSASDVTAGTDDVENPDGVHGQSDEPVASAITQCVGPGDKASLDKQDNPSDQRLHEKKKEGIANKSHLVVGPSNCTVVTLPRAQEICYCYGESGPQPVIPFGLEQEFWGDIAKARRIFNIVLHMEGYNIQNLFSVEPRRYKYLSVGAKDSRKVVLAKDNSNTTFFTVGLVTKSLLIHGKNAKEINIKPLARMWPRCQAVLSQLLKFNNLVVTSYKDGIQFSTMRKPSKNGCELKVKSIAMDGHTHGPPVHAWNIEVPCFIGTEPFKLTDYMKLEPSYTDFDPGDCVLVAFTVGGYKTVKTNAVPALNRASLNVQFAILLELFNSDDAGPASERFPEDL